VRRPLLRHALDAVTEHRAGVLVDRPLDDALVVVDEQARGREDVRLRLLRLVELQRPGDRLRGAAAQLPLIVDGRACGAEIRARRQRPERRWRRGENPIPMIREIRNPSVAFDASANWLRHVFEYVALARRFLCSACPVPGIRQERRGRTAPAR